MTSKWLWFSMAAAALAMAQTQGPPLSVDASAARRPISPDIYGINNYFYEENVPNSNLRANFDAAIAAAGLRVSVRRWGGDVGPRYNWKLDVWNWGNDWYDEIAPDPFNPHPELLPDGSRTDLMLEYARITGGKLLGTVSMLGWLPKVRPPNGPSPCSFPVSQYGMQKRTDPYNSNCGNGVRSDGVTPVQNDPNDIAALFDENYQKEWVQYMVAKYGHADQGGVAIWSLDNEPGAWCITHRDIHPFPQTYNETWELSRTYAEAVKEADPTALVMSPAPPYWASYYYSALDIAAAGVTLKDFSGLPFTMTYPAVPYWTHPVDRQVHGGVDFTTWYLQKFRAYEQQYGKRLLDYFDLHFAFMLAPPASDAERLRLTRVLWDPNFVATDTYWTRDDQGQPAKPRLIPRMHDWVDQNYPGTKLAITEYDFGAHGSIVGGIAEADALGIFGREGLDLATAFFWGTAYPPGDTEWGKLSDPVAFAFRMYRNYDGIGGAFGETSVQATTGDPDQLSIFAAQRSDGALTILVLNKTTGDLSSSIAISNFTAQAKAQAWRYDRTNLNSIVRQPDVNATGGSIDAVFPAYSMTLLVVPAAQAGPKPVITAVTDAAAYRNSVAPGQMVVVWGTNLGPAQLDSRIAVGSNGIVANVMDGLRILFDGVPAPLVYVSQSQCSAVVPYMAALSPFVHVQVEWNGVRSDPYAVAVNPTAPALFTANSRGAGQGSILNQDGRTANSIETPAPPGSVVVLWGTGEGISSTPGVDGRLATDIVPVPAAPCTAEIGGLPATVEYCGAAPGYMPGIFQVNARIDPRVAPGNTIPVRVMVGGSASQDGVTLVVR